MTYITPSELAEKWHREPVTIRLWAREGKLPGAHKVHGGWLIDEKKANIWFQRTEIKPKVASWRSTNEAKRIGYASNGTAKTSASRLEQILGMPH